MKFISKQAVYRLFITSFFICLFISPIQASTFNHEGVLTLSKKYVNVTLGELIKSIEKEEDCVFFFKSETVDLNRKITLDARGLTLEDALSEVFKNTNNEFRVEGRQVYITAVKPNSINQVPVTDASTKVEVSGRVLDNKGEPLIGVSIVEVGQKSGSITDLNGIFKLKVSPNSTLRFSYLGFNTVEKKIGTADSKIEIVLEEELSALDEVVVVGYGTQKKVNLTGAVQSVSSDEIMRRSTASASVALQGLIPGLSAVQSSGQPGGDNASITIRGSGSLNSSTSPLVLIDGVEGDMNRIDLNSVESISILKDAASASIYGSRASNGVILITTKRGKEGKFKISYNGYLGFNNPTCLPESVSAVEYMEAVNVANKNNSQDLSFSEELIDLYRNGGADNYEKNYDTDWKKEVLKNSAFLQNHSVSISGGSDKSRFFASLGYYFQDGQIENNSFSRTNLRLNTDTQLKKWLKVGVDISIRDAHAKRPVMETPVNIIGYALTLNPLVPGRNTDGTYGIGISNGINPIALAEVGGNRNDRAPELGVKGFVELTPFEGFNVLGSYSYRRLDSEVDAFVYPYDVYRGGEVVYSFPSSGSSKYEQRGKNTTKQFNVQASYERNIAKHYIKAMAGMQTEERDYKMIEARRQGYIIPEYNEIMHGDVGTQSNGSDRNDWAMLSYLFRLNYSFADRYLLEANGRYDGTSRFINDNRWGFFPSVSAAWRISEESFFEPLKNTINNLKLRTSYGLLGNQDIGSANYYPYTSEISPGANYWFDKNIVTGLHQTQIANERIKWEKSKQFNIALDAGMFNQKLSFTFDYYIRNISNMLQKFELANFVGMSSPWENAGSMRNKGWELSATWRDRINDFSYYVTANVSDVKNKVTNLYGNEYTTPTSYTVEGYPINSYYGYVSDGIFQSQQEIDDVVAVYGGRKENVKPGDIRYKDINDDGVINAEDRTIIGNRTPRYEYSFTLGGEWKGFDFSLFFQGVGKKDMYYTGPGARPLWGQNSTLYKHQLDYWTEDNKGASYPRLLLDTAGSHANNIMSDFWVRSASYLRLKNLVVGYTLPKNWTRKATLDNVRFYVSCQNLFTVSNAIKGYDPESSISNGNYYPLMRTFNFGVNIDF